MVKKLIYFLVLVLFVLKSFCAAEADLSLLDTSNLKKFDFYNAIDSLTLNWYNAHPYQDFIVNTENETDTNINEYPDSIISERISSIPSIIPLSYNKIVKSFIKVYANQRRDEVENILGLTEYYFPIFEEILEENNLPNELKYLPIIESALNPNAVSRAGATGLWQFMYGTAKMYKLQINSLVDERRDPIKSTQAAAYFLKDLYSIYNDWILVIAAFNCGPGNVNKAIRRSGNKRNYWDIYYYLPRETRGYVPAFIAATYVFNFYSYHNLKPNYLEYIILTDTLVIRKELHLKQISEVLDISHDILRKMNPQYRWDIIPENNNGNILKLPVKYISDFITLEDSIFNYKDSIYFNPELKNSQPTYYAKYSPVTPKGMEKLIYTVKPGDNIGYIAEWYHVRALDIRYWNNINRNLIRSGQKLAIFVSKNDADKYKNINSMTFAEKQRTIGIEVKEDPKEKNITKPSNYELVYYEVKPGDTLWEIAKKYPGVTDYDIMQLNNISSSGKISPGQKLIIHKPIN